MTSHYPNRITAQLIGDSNAQPLFFLHANSYCACMYMPFLDHLISDRYLIAPDLPGHGDSHWEGRITDWASLAEYYEGYLDDLGLDKSLIGIGHSIGGIVLMIMASKRPGLFSKLVLLDPVLLDRKLLFMIRLMRILGQDRHFPLARKAYRRKSHFTSRENALNHYRQKRVFAVFGDDFLERYVDHCMRSDEEGGLKLACDPRLEASIYRSLPLNAWSYLHRIVTPTLVLAGEQSDTLSSAGVRRLEHIGSNIIVKTITGGHLFPFEKSSGAEALIQEFLST